MSSWLQFPFWIFLKSPIKTVHSIAHWNLVWTECVTSSVSRRSLRLAGANSCLINVWVSKICPKLHKFLELSANQVRIGGKLVKKTTYLPAFSQLWERGESTSTFSELHETTLNETLHPLIPSTWAKSNSKRMFDIKLVSVLTPFSEVSQLQNTYSGYIFFFCYILKMLTLHRYLRLVVTVALFQPWYFYLFFLFLIPYSMISFHYRPNHWQISSKAINLFLPLWEGWLKKPVILNWRAWSSVLFMFNMTQAWFTTYKISVGGIKFHVLPY